ncbi:hypothetical protein [Enterococcus dongliensis]|nr:hypothetical protein [Enterococcus dongliensis]
MEPYQVVTIKSSANWGYQGGLEMDIKLDKYRDRIRILVWCPASYDHDDGYYEIAHIKMSKSENSYMEDWNLDELLANLQVRDTIAEFINRTK